MLTQDVVKAIQAELNGQEMEASQVDFKADVKAVQAELKAQGIEASQATIKAYLKAIKAVAEYDKTEVSQATVKAHLNAFETVVVEALKAGEGVSLKGFVSFDTKEVAERTAKNPQTGDDVVVPAHRKASASLAKGLRKF